MDSNLTPADKQTIEIIRERVTRWGGNADIPGDRTYLGQLIIKLADKARYARLNRETVNVLEAELAAQKEELTKTKRQLSAAKARETRLRKQLQEQQGDRHDAA